MENPKTTQQSEGWTTQKREAIRKYFTFYRSFRDALYKVPKQRRLVLYEAIADYALDGIEPSVERMGTVECMVWDLMLPNLLASRKRFLSGTKGGAPKGNNNNPLGNNQWTTNGQPMDNQEDNQRTTERTSCGQASKEKGIWNME